MTIKLKMTLKSSKHIKKFLWDAVNVQVWDALVMSTNFIIAFFSFDWTVILKSLNVNKKNEPLY